eukprot:comp20359_c0_seq1/m.25713 comp20359_c0_seq1/g.25713  ORF comp20359_c0_seq1/g.25713 comp20359_c0_seq1/m.25713 type:complete len:269 (-) comp20359_c0_seq1:816-1622(-)
MKFLCYLAIAASAAHAATVSSDQVSALLAKEKALESKVAPAAAKVGAGPVAEANALKAAATVIEGAKKEEAAVATQAQTAGAAVVKEIQTLKAKAESIPNQAEAQLKTIANQTNSQIAANNAALTQAYKEAQAKIATLTKEIEATKNNYTVTAAKLDAKNDQLRAQYNTTVEAAKKAVNAQVAATVEVLKDKVEKLQDIQQTVAQTVTKDEKAIGQAAAVIQNADKVVDSVVAKASASAPAAAPSAPAPAAPSAPAPAAPAPTGIQNA